MRSRTWECSAWSVVRSRCDLPRIHISWLEDVGLSFMERQQWLGHSQRGRGWLIQNKAYQDSALSKSFAALRRVTPVS